MRPGDITFPAFTTGDRRERLRSAARLFEEADAARIRAELRADRGDHRRGAAARGAPGVVVGNATQSAGKNAAARGVHGRRLHRDPAGGWQDGAVQEDDGQGSSRFESRLTALR